MKNQGLRFVQRGGAGNSLGRIVFRLLNNCSIYLHDTNQKYVFDRDRRTVSHGCVRVEKPFELASFMLPDVDDWTLDRLRISMDIPPVTERGMKWLKDHAGSPRPYKLLAYHAITPKMPI
jgi:murein L,D-transpeptidase YcbB/YkuD